MGRMASGGDDSLRLEDIAQNVSDDDGHAPVASASSQAHGAHAPAAARSRRRRRPWPWVAVAVVLVAAIGLGTWWGTRSRHSSGTPSSTPVTYTVTPTTLQQSVTTTGTFAPATQENLWFPASGSVTAVSVKVGQTVNKGQVLATEDTAALQAAVASAQASLDAADTQVSALQAASSSTATQLSAARATVAADSAKLAQAKQNLAGATMTSPIKGIVAAVNLTAGTAASGGTSSTGSLGTSGSGASGSGSGGGNSGGSGGAGTSQGAASNAQVVVVDTSSWIVNATVGAADLPSLRAGLQATMNLSAAATTGSGSGYGRLGGGLSGGSAAGSGGFGAASGISGLGGGTRGSSRQGSTGQGSTNQGSGQAAQAPQHLVFGTVQSFSEIATTSSGTAAFPVTIAVTGQPTGVYIGSSASVSIMVKQVSNVLAVPTVAISESSSDQPSVQVLVNGQQQTRPVGLGQVYGSQTQVTSGLQAGDQVVVTTRVRGARGAAGYGGYGNQGAVPGGGSTTRGR